MQAYFCLASCLPRMWIDEICVCKRLYRAERCDSIMHSLLGQLISFQIITARCSKWWRTVRSCHCCVSFFHYFWHGSIAYSDDNTSCFVFCRSSHGAFPFSMLLVPFRVGFTQQIPLCSGSDRVLRTHCLHRNVMACGHLRRFKYRRPQESFDQHYAAVFTILAGHRSCFRVFFRYMKATSGSRCDFA